MHALLNATETFFHTSLIDAWRQLAIDLPPAEHAGYGLLFILGTTLVLASVNDMRSGRIPNQLLLWAFAIAIPVLVLMNLVEGVPLAFVADGGESVAGAIVLFSITFAIWLLGGFGGGDVKLLTFIGLVIGVERGIAVLFLAQVLAALFIVGRQVLIAHTRTGEAGKPDQPVPMAGFFSLSVVAVIAQGYLQ